MKNFWENGGKVLLVLIVIAGAYYSVGLQAVRQKGIEANAVMELRLVHFLALGYLSETGSYTGFCESEPMRTYRWVLEANEPVGLDTRTVMCFASNEQYAVSMTVFNVFTDMTHACLSNSSKEGREAYQMVHVTSETCG